MLLVIILFFFHYDRIMEQYQNNEQLLLKCLGLLVNLTSSSRVCACVCMSGSWACLHGAQATWCA